MDWRYRLLCKILQTNHVLVRSDFDTAFNLALQGLTPREGFVITSLYVNNMEDKTLARKIGVDCKRLNQIHDKAIRKLRSNSCIKRFTVCADYYEREHKAMKSGSTPLSILGLNPKTQILLENSGVTTVEGLSSMSLYSLGKIKGIGEIKRQMIIETLKKHGIVLREY